MGKLKSHVHKKFNQKGFYLLQKNKEKFYTNICFGNPISFQSFKTDLINGSIYLDSGMKEFNSRNYSTFRANQDYWKSHIIEEY